MKSDIIIAGVGGQGILSIAACIGMAALKSNLYIRQSEVHGMSQRGGAVISNLRISDSDIASDLIPLGQANLILSVEPMESLRYLPWLAVEGWVVTNNKPVKNIPEYPDQAKLIEEIKSIKNSIIIDADKIAMEIGSPRSSNMVMLGAAIPFIKIDYPMFEEGIRSVFGMKGEEIINYNIKAVKAGRESTENNLNKSISNLSN